MAKENRFYGATPSGARGTKQYTRQQVLKVKKWDQEHIDAINKWFDLTLQLGEQKPVLVASSKKDLLAQVDDIYAQHRGGQMAKAFVRVVRLTKINPDDLVKKIESIYEDLVKNHCGTISDEKLEILMALLKIGSTSDY